MACKYSFQCCCCFQHFQVEQQGRRPPKAEIARMVCQECCEASREIRERHIQRVRDEMEQRRRTRQ